MTQLATEADHRESLDLTGRTGLVVGIANEHSLAWSAAEHFRNAGAVTVTDPVCGMQVGILEAAAQEDHGGWAHFFCSAQCHRLFRANPERYVVRAQPSAVSSTADTERDDHGQG